MTEPKIPPNAVVPHALRDAPALIEKLLPVQKLSAESYKEQMAGAGKTLTALGSYWKGRKPLILAKACVLGCLLPAGDDPQADLAIFEKLMAMDDESMVVRLGRRPGVADILARVRMENFRVYFTVTPDSGLLPSAAPFSLSDYGTVRAATRGGRRAALLRPHAESAHPTEIEIAWRDDVSENERRRWEAGAMPERPYREMVDAAQRAEQVGDEVHTHIWDDVNAHLGTHAHSFPELVEQLGVMRFGHRPRLADTFCGSGQIAFEAARLGCDVYASDLNPVAAMLTWGAFHIVGGSTAERARLAEAQQRLIASVQAEVDALGVESDGRGWRAKVYLYCVEARCPQTGWMVPLLPSLIISSPRSSRDGNCVAAKLIPDPVRKRYDVAVLTGLTRSELTAFEQGTVRSEGPDPYLVHTVDGVEYRIKISTLRGDYTLPDGSSANRLRLWEKEDFKPRRDDIFQERLYAVQWLRPQDNRRNDEYEFRAVSEADLARERFVEEYVAAHLAEWQQQGWVPDMRIEPGYNTRQPIWERGWTHWHHLFSARQLLVAGLVNQRSDARLKFGLCQLVNWNSRLCRWNVASGGGGSVQDTFYNQALNTLLNHGCRGFMLCSSLLEIRPPAGYTLDARVSAVVKNDPTSSWTETSDLFITDPPYGDAVNYHEILEFFIAWLRKNPPPEFAGWVWDSRRALAIKGEDEAFRQGMVAAYRRMAECMPDNGIQVIMFTHQSGSIWADMAGIVWASGLQVTAAWYVVTETDSALREGSYVKGTVLLVVRKRRGRARATEDDLAWEIEEEVRQQVESLTGLNQQAKGLYRGENLFEDVDLQMAGYAAALRVLTRYAVINGKDMAAEAVRPRLRGETTFVDDLIAFAVGVANAHLVPHGIAKDTWAKLAPAERFYLKLLELEARGLKTLDNYQNFAKAFKVADYQALMGSKKANSARLKSAAELGRSEMGEGSELTGALRGVLYALMELTKDVDADEVLAHLALNAANYMDQTQRDLVVELADYLAVKLATIRPEEAAAARVLRERVRNQRL